MTDTVLYEVSDAVATVTLNRPARLNAILSRSVRPTLIPRSTLSC